MTPESAVRTLAELHGLESEGAGQLMGLTEALASEPDPPTAIREPEEIVDRHLADSLAGLHFAAVRGARRIADVGSGAGFPGLPLAVAIPRAKVDLIEAARRKCEVIGRLARAAKLRNATVVAARVEAWATADGRDAYDVVATRAVASLPVLAEYAAPLLELGGSLVAWRGRREPGEERAATAAAKQLGLEYVEVVAVRPFPDARDRHLHRFVKREMTPPDFPRRPGRAAKRPLSSFDPP